MSNALCFSCYDDITWRMHGLTENFNTEIKRYTTNIYEGLTVDCENCGRTAIYNSDEPTGKWLQSYVEVVK
ncbi:hypothetical protein [Lysinibacillus sphaericus]|uniref:hypothetical protein n=1 Tax=Lysinibacillus sphaericus TaxID=1421 RepID=UPI003D7F4266